MAKGFGPQIHKDGPEEQQAPKGFPFSIVRNELRTPFKALASQVRSFIFYQLAFCMLLGKSLTFVKLIIAAALS